MTTTTTMAMTTATPRERALKIALVVVGLIFVAMFYGIVTLRDEEALQMMFSLYVTLGVFLLMAARNPAANRSLIAFTGWSSLAHASVMAAQARYDAGERMHMLLGTAMFAIVGIVLLSFAPPKARVPGS